MNALSNKYEKPSAINKVYLIWHLFNFKMSKGASDTNHNNVNVIVSQLTSIEIDFDDEVCASILLSLLFDCWNTMITTATNSFWSTSLTFDEISNLILNEDIFGREYGKLVTAALVGEV